MQLGYLSIEQGCPECSGILQRRHNPQAKEHFLGCSNYPHCHYTTHYSATEQLLAKEAQSLWVEIARLDTLLMDLIDDVPTTADLYREYSQAYHDSKLN